MSGRTRVAGRVSQAGVLSVSPPGPSVSPLAPQHSCASWHRGAALYGRQSVCRGFASQGPGLVCGDGPLFPQKVEWAPSGNQASQARVSRRGCQAPKCRDRF